MVLGNALRAAPLPLAVAHLCIMLQLLHLRINVVLGRAQIAAQLPLALHHLAHLDLHNKEFAVHAWHDARSSPPLSCSLCIQEEVCILKRLPGMGCLLANGQSSCGGACHGSSKFQLLP